MSDYLKNPDAIYSLSFATIAAETDFSLVPANARAIVSRMIHACGMTDIVKNVVVSHDFVPEARRALGNGGKIIVDAEMVRHGIIDHLLPQRDRIICTLNDERTRPLASEMANTRSAASVELWRPHLEGSIIVIGNAPTALFHLLDIIDGGARKPAAIVGLPVGFVGAAESKDQLIGNSRGIPFLALRGRQGGSAMAASVINALLSDDT
ncbi:MAG: precorrin-8X methylmutase [Phyllobacteriaceae bacterium]|nr:precorrin-8X methylmutase [Phyllobacteriaceae bacterium]